MTLCIEEYVDFPDEFERKYCNEKFSGARVREEGKWIEQMAFEVGRSFLVRTQVRKPAEKRLERKSRGKAQVIRQSGF